MGVPHCILLSWWNAGPRRLVHVRRNRLDGRRPALPSLQYYCSVTVSGPASLPEPCSLPPLVANRLAFSPPPLPLEIPSPPSFAPTFWRRRVSANQCRVYEMPQPLSSSLPPLAPRSTPPSMSSASAIHISFPGTTCSQPCSIGGSQTHLEHSSSRR